MLVFAKFKLKFKIKFVSVFAKFKAEFKTKFLLILRP